jgi:hypothetical protein
MRETEEDSSDYNPKERGIHPSRALIFDCQLMKYSILLSLQPNELSSGNPPEKKSNSLTPSFS